MRGGLSQQKHPDIIAIADHALDTHGSHSHGIGELREPYGVPYRCLIPKGLSQPADRLPRRQLQLPGRLQLPAVAHA